MRQLQRAWQRTGLVALAGLSAATSALAMGRPDAGAAQAPGRAASGLYTTTRTPETLRDKQLVLETDKGEIVIDLFADDAPNHVGFVLDQAEAGAYDGTTFHRAVPMGIVQGGDPISKDPSKRELYGTGGLNRLAREPNARRHERGAVSAVQIPGRPDSAGAQFFICITDQPTLDGQYTVFGEVVEGLEVAEDISNAPLDAEGRLRERIAIVRATVRDRPPATAAPFADTPVTELARYRARLETNHGTITLSFLPDVAPQHVRNFLRLAELGVYDGTAFHRVVPGFAIQGGDLSSREGRLTQKQRRHVGTVPAEFNATPHVKGTLSMARGDDPDSASTSFFICTAPAPTLDGVYTAFGEVVDGMDVVERIEQVPVNGDAPVTRVELTRVTITREP
jgi:cyclophilin family peptidyl-prolyl cis-trans isomerase